LDAAAFPNLTRYLSLLPAGLESYPECRTKGILLRSSVREIPWDPSWEALPEPIVEAMRDPPIPTAWISTVLTNAAHLAVADTHHPTAQALLAWNYERTMKATASPMYRMITRVAGLKNFLRGAVKVHGLFQQGTDLSMHFRAETHAEVLLEHPPHLHGGHVHLANEAVFAAALDASGARSSNVKMIESSARRAVYDVIWEW
jgi:hypothetical protein